MNFVKAIKSDAITLIEVNGFCARRRAWMNAFWSTVSWLGKKLVFVA